MPGKPRTETPAPQTVEIELDLPLTSEAAGRMVAAAVYPVSEAQPMDSTPMGLLQRAVDRGADLATIEKLMDLNDRNEASIARKAYYQAFSDFKAEAVEIIKNITVSDGPLKGKMYADLAAVVDSATPALSKHGLSASWKVTKDDKDWIEVTCTLRHVMGHFETNAFGGPPDSGGAKNPIQARASTKSYLERYTFLGITGLAAKGQDSDGMVPDMPEAAFQGHLQAIRQAETLNGLHEVYSKAYKAAGRDQVTQKAIIKAKDERKAELMGVAK